MSIPNSRKPTEWEKNLLVLFKDFKSKRDIPEILSAAKLNRVDLKYRYTKYTGLMVGAMIISAIVAYRAKQQQHQGISFASMNVNWHRMLAEQEKQKKKQL